MSWLATSSRSLQTTSVHGTGARRGVVAAAAHPPPRRVLLTNDDGPDSPFFNLWVEHVRSQLGWVGVETHMAQVQPMQYPYEVCRHVACLICRWNAVVCVPAAPQSFVSKGITRTPIQVRPVSLYRSCMMCRQSECHAAAAFATAQVHRKADQDFHIEAAPASCVNLGVYSVAPDADLVLAGPNVGHNAGRSVACTQCRVCSSSRTQGLECQVGGLQGCS